MPSTPVAQVQRKDYPHTSILSTRWNDNDSYGHVNNVTYYSYFDTVVNDYLIKHSGLDIHKSEVIAFVVKSECVYHKAISFPEEITLGLRVNRLGNSSVEYGLAVFKADLEQAAAEGTFVHVFVNRESGKPQSIPGQIRASLDALKCD